MTTIQRIRLRDLAARLGCELHGDPDIEITGVAGVEQAGPSDLTFLSNPKYSLKVKSTRARRDSGEGTPRWTGPGPGRRAWYRRIRITISRGRWLCSTNRLCRSQASIPKRSSPRQRESAKERQWGRSRW